MPVAPKFSEKFYEKFGHDFVTELVDWLGNMDLTYRAELRELNELNFSRLEARLDLRVGQVETRLRQEIGELRSEMRAGFAELESRLTSRLLRWMFVFWTGTTITLLGAMFAMLKL
jgi:hypothetical protein